MSIDMWSFGCILAELHTGMYSCVGPHCITVASCLYGFWNHFSCFGKCGMYCYAYVSSTVDCSGVLYLGYPLFPGENEVEQLACIMEIFGLPPVKLLDEAQRRKIFFGKWMAFRMRSDNSCVLHTLTHKHTLPLYSTCTWAHL